MSDVTLLFGLVCGACDILAHFAACGERLSL